MNDNKELTTHSIYCPKCGRLFQWMITEEPKYSLVVLHLRCGDCGTSDALALTSREFMEKVLGGEKGKLERPQVIDNCDMNVFEPEKYMRGIDE